MSVLCLLSCCLNTDKPAAGLHISFSPLVSLAGTRRNTFVEYIYHAQTFISQNTPNLTIIPECGPVPQFSRFFSARAPSVVDRDGIWMASTPWLKKHWIRSSARMLNRVICTGSLVRGALGRGSASSLGGRSSQLKSRRRYTGSSAFKAAFDFDDNRKGSCSSVEFQADMSNYWLPRTSVLDSAGLVIPQHTDHASP
jgi:hypothetical protein